MVHVLVIYPKICAYCQLSFYITTACTGKYLDTLLMNGGPTLLTLLLRVQHSQIVLVMLILHCNVLIVIITVFGFNHDDKRVQKTKTIITHHHQIYNHYIKVNTETEHGSYSVGVLVYY